VTQAQETTDPVRQLLDFLAANHARLSPLLVLTHDFPDPDALASAWGLRELARAFKIDARVMYGGVISRAENRAMVKLLRMPLRKLKPADLKRHRHVALVDTQPRFENNPFPPDRRATLVLDQHASAAAPDADLAIVDTTCGATCVIVAQALLRHGVELGKPLATAIAYGILSDTLDLYRVTRPDVIQTYLAVLRQCDMRILAGIQNPPRSRRFFTTLGRSIQVASAYRRVMVAHLGPVSSPEEVAQVADFLLTYERADWSFCTGRARGGRLYLSLRSNKVNAQAGEVLRHIVNDPDEAGGHGGVAGGRVMVGKGATDEAWHALEHTLQARLARRLRLPATAEFRRVFGGAALS
jgi:nanoRNase/pAp phosphatase (c-di-AMP/oligoRNAs hydrolase)